MFTPNQFIFYVQNPLESTKFYEKIFLKKPDLITPNYVSFSFENGLYFSLWSTQAKNFVSGGTGHRSELAYLVPDEASVRELRKQWVELGVIIEEDLFEAIFGLTFVALDPDGHRIRVSISDKQ